MRKITYTLFCLIFCACMFTGCDQIKELTAPRFDATSIDSFKESTKKINQTLSADDQTKLNQALLYNAAVYIKEHPGEALLNGGAALLMDEDISDTAIKFIMKDLDGKTAKQVIQEYEQATAK